MLDEFFEGEINKKSVFITFLTIIFFYGLKVGFFLLILYYLNHKDNVRIDILIVTIIFLVLFVFIINILRTKDFYKPHYDKLLFIISLKVLIAFSSALAFYYLERKKYDLMIVFGTPIVVFGLITIYYVIKKVVFKYKKM